MKKLLMAAAAIAVVATPGLIGESQAAPKAKKSPYCAMAKSQRNSPQWNEFYHCLDLPARQSMAHAAPAPKRTAAVNPDRGPGSQYCKLANSQRNAPQWSEFYGCLKH